MSTGAGQLADNIVHFARVLRRAGLPIGPAKVIDAIHAVQAVGIERRDDFRHALAAVLVNRREHEELFDQAFEMFWRDPYRIEQALQELLRLLGGLRRVEMPPPKLAERVARALLPGGLRVPRPAEERPPELEADARFTVSAREVLQHKDFAAMTPEELAEAKEMLRQLRLPLPQLASRRLRPDARGARVDLRATMRQMARQPDGVIALQHRSPQRRHPTLVVLCDISGSMESYTRMLLHFVHAITNDRDRVYTFLFGTRLTHITRHLRHRDVDVALAGVTAAVADWAGGTRIGACLKEFNQRWARRLLGQGAVVLLISDGLDSDAAEGLAPEMERLARSSRQLIWLNPLLRYAGFEAKPAGIRAMLPHVDAFLPVHNLVSLARLGEALSALGGTRRGYPQRSAA
ncbi:MAG TPA: VWA domain-containing protein [Burkholderiales bacterium]